MLEYENSNGYGRSGKNLNEVIEARINYEISAKKKSFEKEAKKKYLSMLDSGENGSGKVSVIFSTLHAMAGRPFQYSHKPPSCLKHILRIYFWTLT